jgi:hypothetical protein
MTECDLCARQSPVLEFSRICCRVRFVLTLPSRELRAEWLERWRAKDGRAMAEKIEREVREKWTKQRDCTKQ